MAPARVRRCSILLLAEGSSRSQLAIARFLDALVAAVYGGILPLLVSTLHEQVLSAGAAWSPLPSQAHLTSDDIVYVAPHLNHRTPPHRCHLTCQNWYVTPNTTSCSRTASQSGDTRLLIPRGQCFAGAGS